MKTPKEWMDLVMSETNDPNQKGYTHEVLLTQEAIAAIQQDAFESGRVWSEGQWNFVCRRLWHAEYLLHETEPFSCLPFDWTKRRDEFLRPPVTEPTPTPPDNQKGGS